MKDAILKAVNVNRIFPVAGQAGFQALKDITMEIPKGTLTILKGPSGSGKTTLMNILGALDNPTSGSVYFEQEEISAYHSAKKDKFRKIMCGFVFQSVSLIPMMSAYENVEFGWLLAGNKKNGKDRITECLSMVGLEKRMKHMPQEMSGGEQQRVAIARAMVHNPKIIFADEPTAELDSNTGLVMVNLFKTLVEKEGITVVMTTHDTGLMGAADILFELKDGELIHE